VIQLKNEILSKIATPTDYARFEKEHSTGHSDFGMADSLRGRMLLHDVKWFNDQGKVPAVVDFAPGGEFFMPFILKKRELKFTYWPICLYPESVKRIEGLYEIQKPKAQQPYIYLALEIIEHLWSPNDIKTHAFAIGAPDIIHVSTPLYTHDYACKNWRDKALLGHLRAYTASDLYSILGKLFPEYEPSLALSQIMHCRMVHRKTRELVKKGNIDVTATV
jgi:hypothetical protein